MSERKLFTLYGFNERSKKIQRITKEESKGLFKTPDNKTSEVFLFDEVKKALRKNKPSLCFSEFYKKEGWGVCIIKPEAFDFKNILLKNIVKKLAFGEDMDIEKAREMFEEQEKKALEKQEAPTEKSAALYNLAFEYLNEKREYNKLNGEVNGAKAVLKQFEDGQVIKDGDDYYAIMMGRGRETQIIDKELLEKDDLYDKFKTTGSNYFVVKVSDGTKDPVNKTIKVDAYTLKPAEILYYADVYEAEYPLLKTKEKEVDKLRDEIIAAFPEGNSVIKKGPKSLIVTIEPVKGKEIVDVEALKRAGLYEKYLKTNQGGLYISSKKLSK